MAHSKILKLMLLQDFLYHRETDGFSMIRHIFDLCGCGGIGRRARFRFWWETVQVQVLLPAVEQEKSGRQDLNLFKLLLPAVEQETERRIRREVFGFYGRFRE